MGSSLSCPKPEYLSQYDENYYREIELKRQELKRNFTVHVTESETSMCDGSSESTSSIVKKARISGETSDHSETTRSILIRPLEQGRINEQSEVLNVQRISPEKMQPTIDRMVTSSSHGPSLRNAQSCPNLAACFNSTFHIANEALSSMTGKNEVNGTKLYSVEPPSKAEYYKEREVFMMVHNLFPRTTSSISPRKDVSWTADENMLMETD